VFRSHEEPAASVDPGVGTATISGPVGDEVVDTPALGRKKER
jgi:hypothetical protein